MYRSSQNCTSPLQVITCHMGSHNLPPDTSEYCTPCFNHSQTALDLGTLKMQERLENVATKCRGGICRTEFLMVLHIPVLHILICPPRGMEG